jgi:hypothetical protein
MKKSSATFLQAVIAFSGAGAMAFLLWEPHIEGRNAHATLVEIYFKDPFLAYAYIASIPLFVALYKGFKALGYAGKTEVFPQKALKALLTIKYCAIAIIGFVALGEVFLLRMDSDDRAGGVFMGVLIAFGSVIVAAAAAKFERIMQNASDRKSESHGRRQK